MEAAIFLLKISGSFFVLCALWVVSKVIVSDCKEQRTAIAKCFMVSAAAILSASVLFALWFL